MTDINQYYRELGLKCNSILDETLNTNRLEMIAKNHSTLFDFNTCIETLKERPEYSILQIALREYQMSLLSITIGLYNQAFISLRFFFERTLVAILFSAKEIDLRLWLRGERDTYWKEIVDDDSGVFSNSFCRAFFPEIKDESLHFKKMAQKVYRECSEYVHGNYCAQQKIPDILKFDEFLFNEWQNKAGTIRRIILFVFCIRHLKVMSAEQSRKIESIILDEFSHLPAINEVFNK